MARRQQNDDLLMEDELEAAFLDDPLQDDALSSDDQQVEEQDDDDYSSVPGQLALDVYETTDRLIIKARVAGVNKSDLDVSISDNQLSIRGTLNSGDDAEAVNYYVQECYWGEFSRSITLPVQVKEDEIEATLKDGVLTIGFRKVQETVKKIQVL
jgi:HSP20 family protein